MVRRSWLSATALSTHAWCQTKPFLQRMLDAAGVDLTTPAMTAGIAAHAEVQDATDALAEPSDLTFPEALREGSFLLANEFPLRDNRRRLRGIADVTFASKGRAYVLELKNSVPAPDGHAWPEHAIQTQFYGLLAQPKLGEARLAVSYLRATGRAHLLHSLIHQRDPETALLELYQRSAAVPSTAEAFADINLRIRAFRKQEKRDLLPDPGHDDAKRCAACSLRRWCPRRRDRPGEFAAIPRA